MKFLGQYNRKVALKYQDILADAGIIVTFEDWSNSYEQAAGFALMRLFVAEDEYEKSMTIIGDFERKAAQKVENIDRAQIRKWIGVLIGVVIFCMIIAYIRACK